MIWAHSNATGGISEMGLRGEGEGRLKKLIEAISR